MNTLIMVASKHGSTREIAEVIANELRSLGIIADVRSVGEQVMLDHYDAVIVGSAVYVGSWMPEARQFIDRNQEQLANLPVWLFSSGPIGNDPMPKGDPNHLDELMRATKARDHRMFVGKLDHSGLGFGERMIVRVVGAAEGDFRDWEAIRGWAREIGSALQVPVGKG